MYQSFLFRSAGRNHAQQSPSCGPLARLAAGAYCLVGDYSRYVTVGGCCQVDWVVIAPHAHPGAAQDLDEAVCGVEAAEDVEGGDGHAGLLSLRLEDGHAGVAAGTQNVLIVALLSIGHVGGVSAAGVPHISRQGNPQMIVAGPAASRSGFRERNLFLSTASGVTSTELMRWYLDPRVLNAGIGLPQLSLPMNVQLENKSKETISPPQGKGPQFCRQPQKFVLR